MNLKRKQSVENLNTRFASGVLAGPSASFPLSSRNWFHFVFLFEGFFKEGSVCPCSEEIEEWGFLLENGLPPLSYLHQEWIQEMGEKNRKVVL